MLDINQFLNDVKEQPAVLKGIGDYYAKDGAQMLRRLRRVNPRQIVCSGMGSSFYAAMRASYWLWAHRLPALPVNSSDLLHHGNALLDANTWLLLISQSGESAETIAVANNAYRKCSIIGITNQLDSSLAQLSDLAFPMLAGNEFVTASKTYMASVAVALLVCSSLLGIQDTILADINKVADKINMRIQSDSQWQIQQLADLLNRHERVFIVGRGPWTATAKQAALTAKEYVRIPAEAMEAGMFRHGPLEILDERAILIAFASDRPTESLIKKLAQQARSLGTIVTLIVDGEVVPGINAQAYSDKVSNECLANLIDLYPLQAACARAKILCGGDESFRAISKVTSTE